MFNREEDIRQEFTDFVRKNDKDKLEEIREDGHTALSFAVFKGYNIMVEEILEKGVNPNKKVNVSLDEKSSRQTLSPIEIAEYKSHVQCMTLLKKAIDEYEDQLVDKNKGRPKAGGNN